MACPRKQSSLGAIMSEIVTERMQRNMTLRPYQSTQKNFKILVCIPNQIYQKESRRRDEAPHLKAHTFCKKIFESLLATVLSQHLRGHD